MNITTSKIFTFENFNNKNKISLLLIFELIAIFKYNVLFLLFHNLTKYQVNKNIIYYVIYQNIYALKI